VESDGFEPSLFVAKELSFEQNELKSKLVSQTLRLSCKEIGVCLSSFSAEHLISLALKSSRKISADISPCSGCELNKNGKLLSIIEQLFESSNRFLEEFGAAAIELQRENISTRRDFLRTLLKRGAKVVEEVKEEGFEKPKTKLPLKRILLKSSIKERLDEDNRFIKSDFLFARDKSISDSCTNCKACVEFCPTNALFYSSDFSKIYFQSGKCVDCYICNDICEPKAFTDGFVKDMATFAFDKATAAVEHNLVVCSSCKVAFASKKGEDVCPICVSYSENFSDMFLTAEELESRVK